MLKRYSLKVDPKNTEAYKTNKPSQGPDDLCHYYVLSPVAELQRSSLAIIWSHIIASTQFGLTDLPLDCESRKQSLVLFLDVYLI